ncbi:MAG: hypothetical protein GY944_08840, partial [bacterium]|nr:hypothetical protein [bacterium]
MKKALALGAFALAMALPLVSSASSITTSFVGSSTGTDTINISDTITFGITVHLDIGSTYPAHGLTMSGDVANTNVDNPLTHDLTLQTVTGITVNPAFGVNFVDWSGTFTQILGTNDTNSGHFARYTAVDVAAAPLG